MAKRPLTYDDLKDLDRPALLARLRRARDPVEAGRIGLRILGTIFTRSPGRWLAPDELDRDARAALGALAASPAAAQSGDLDLALAMSGVPEQRAALARFARGGRGGADTPVATRGGPRPFWKVVDGVVHDRQPLAAARRDVRALAPAAHARAWSALLDAIARGDERRLTLPAGGDDDLSEVRERRDVRALVEALAALAPSDRRAIRRGRGRRDTFQGAAIRGAVLARIFGAAATEDELAPARSVPATRGLVAKAPPAAAPRTPAAAQAAAAQGTPRRAAAAPRTPRRRAAAARPVTSPRPARRAPARAGGARVRA